MHGPRIGAAAAAVAAANVVDQWLASELAWQRANGGGGGDGAPGELAGCSFNRQNDAHSTVAVRPFGWPISRLRCSLCEAHS